ncbi:SDR family NAD(P)-dependent oxidoreductase [Streptomyces malaysiensis]|uniref:SDR family NAD(P)-dependent oxidoreductase n=1 Tax=Streptomyces malaysiensis TaxID=92644 RepID=UPI002B308615|nr:SDR family oxidoreductase [Streptomyces malaysiensis]
MSKRFADKVVLVTGSGGGQGREAALAFAREGARVLGGDVAEHRSRETTELVRAAGGEMISMEPVDLTSPASAGEWAGRAIAEWGRIDVVYNNAAGVRFGGIDQLSLEDWEFTLRNELTIHFVVAAAAWPHLVAGGGGVIVNIASCAAHREISLFPAAAHGVANAGILALTRHLAAEGARHGIRCVSLSPGHVDNPNAPSRRSTDPAVRARVAEMPTSVPLGRLARLADIIEPALFLASDEASYITGVDLAVDGGLTSTVVRTARPEPGAR